MRAGFVGGAVRIGKCQMTFELSEKLTMRDS
ncbi:MAG: hypothetical protein ACJAS4_002379 [Bacteriovoracaceae bacterium]|jgi:hypothetical protein